MPKLYKRQSTTSKKPEWAHGGPSTFKGTRHDIDTSNAIAKAHLAEQAKRNGTFSAPRQDQPRGQSKK